MEKKKKIKKKIKQISLHSLRTASAEELAEAGRVLMQQQLEKVCFFNDVLHILWVVSLCLQLQ